MLSTGSLIKLFRERKGFKQNTFAEKLNVTPTYLSLVEKGKREASLTFYKDVSRELNVPVWMLVWDDFALPDRPTKGDIEIKEKLDQFMPDLRDFMLKKILHEKK